MKIWWRRNWLPLVAALVLVPLTIGVTFGSEWWQYFSGRPVMITAGRVGSPTFYAQTEFTVADSSRIIAGSDTGRARGLPAGSDLIVITVTVDPKRVHSDGTSALCTMELQELEGSRVARRWHDATFSPIDFTPTDGAKSGCSPEVQHSYRVQVPFVVPTGAGTGTTELALLLYSADALPRALRVRL